MRQWSMFGPAVTALIIGLGWFAFTQSRPADSLSTQSRYDARSADETDLMAQARTLDAELKQSNELRRVIKGILNDMAAGALNLTQATAQAEQAIGRHYPRFLRYVALNYRGRSDRETPAHYLVMRTIIQLGPPSASERTATMLREYTNAYHPDRSAWENLEQWMPARIKIQMPNSKHRIPNAKCQRS